MHSVSINTLELEGCQALASGTDFQGSAGYHLPWSGSSRKNMTNEHDTDGPDTRLFATGRHTPKPIPRHHIPLVQVCTSDKALAARKTGQPVNVVRPHPVVWDGR